MPPLSRISFAADFSDLQTAQDLLPESQDRTPYTVDLGTWVCSLIHSEELGSIDMRIALSCAETYMPK